MTFTPMTDDRFYEIRDFMDESSSVRSPMSVMSALRWCESEACCCMGCANGSGKITDIGVTKSEWQEWWHRAIDEFVGKRENATETMIDQNQNLLSPMYAAVADGSFSLFDDADFPDVDFVKLFAKKPV